jgi:hypothetical protein
MSCLDFNTHPGTQILEHIDTPSTGGMQHFCLSVCIGVIQCQNSPLSLCVCIMCVHTCAFYIIVGACTNINRNAWCIDRALSKHSCVWIDMALCVLLCVFLWQKITQTFVIADQWTNNNLLSFKGWFRRLWSEGAMTMSMTLAPESQVYKVMMPMELASQSI